MMPPPPRLVLGSASPRRLELLRQLGLEPAAIVHADIDEHARSGERPREYALRLACEKAGFVSQREQGALVLAADTVVACGRRILPKAELPDHARHCLALLSGRAHRVYTGVALAFGGKIRTRTALARVQVKRLSPDEIEAYLASGEWQGKAGGYAIQGRFAAFVRNVEGSYSAIVGLPLFETAQLLDGAGYAPYRIWRAR